MNFENIIYSKDNGIGTIKLNRPKMFNSLSVATWKEINAALDDVEKDSEVRVVILTGEGKAFSAGDDITEFGQLARNEDSMKNFACLVADTMDRIEHFAKPVIAAVNGMAMGGGCELTLCSDVVVASEQAVFGLPEGKIGAIAGVAVFKLPHIVGTKKAKELILTGDTIDAAEALRIGMVNKVVPADQLEAAATKMAKKMCSLGPISAQVSKEMINQTSGRLTQSADIAMRIMTTNDFKEGFDAFMNKRAPQFKGN